MVLRLHLDMPLTGRPSAVLELPPAAVRHVQVRRLQPGDALRVFDGRGAEWCAEVVAMGRQRASVRLLEPAAALAELALRVTLAVGVPANERMDALVEKATELGVAAIQPLTTERSVLRLDGARAERRREHWQAVASAASEQCGRATVPSIGPLQSLAGWLATLTPAAAPGEDRWLLSPAASSQLADRCAATPAVQPDAAAPGPDAAPQARHGDAPQAGWLALSGPEGGLSAAEEALAGTHGFEAVSLGPRILRADTAPLALMAWVALRSS
jgi:16S rRNA (uracil1498-N3)-methyltransferase